MRAQRSFLASSPPTVNRNTAQIRKTLGNHSIEWRCGFCRRILGLLAGGQVQVKDRNRVLITASLPVTSQCPRCKRMNTKES